MIGRRGRLFFGRPLSLLFVVFGVVCFFIVGTHNTQIHEVSIAVD